ncbi:acyl-CoA dehydrogenase family protein [Dethiosulfatarculus sandiegensis]|uniref:Acyl-CoA dehydrogenase n=1 Tax=Dethiosulfatarculus sandiegensis TaxID=1429043 RepID=A0A0D2JAI1_9BACT|nr:acyl-CoA dehydrogenase family protein [Dethiosulfatarculus sandiegensis]KIX12736.1 hypothetical protein X474_17800 [Dethiosulfatarculus sandiegensis]
MLSFENHESFRSYIEDFVQKEIAPLAPAIESEETYPQKAHKAFAREKLFCLAMPKSHGGGGADTRSLALLVESIARVSPSAALLVFPTNAVMRTIDLTGTQEQKDRFFTELSQGDMAMAFCLTEPEHGSDAFDMVTTARKENGHYLVNGVKSYTTLGSNARYYLTFVRTGPRPKAGGISALLIPKDAPGLEFGPPEKKMGLHGSMTSQMYMSDAKVPIENRLWDEGEGWKVLTRVANPMRVWGAASLALGTAQGLFDTSLAHAAHKKKKSQATGFTLADMAMKIESCRAFIYKVCEMVDKENYSPKKIETYTSMAKCLAADTAMEVSELAGRVLGTGMMQADSQAARFFCVAKGIQIFDGSNQIQRLIIARNLQKSGL